MTGPGHEAGRPGRGSPTLTPSQRREQETTSATTKGRRHEAGRRRHVPLLLLPVRDASRRRHPTGRRGDGTRPGAVDEVLLLSLPVRDPSSRRRLQYQPEVSRESETGTTESEECIRPGRPSEGSPVNSFPQVELGAPP